MTITYEVVKFAACQLARQSRHLRPKKAFFERLRASPFPLSYVFNPNYLSPTGCSCLRAAVCPHTNVPRASTPTGCVPCMSVRVRTHGLDQSERHAPLPMPILMTEHSSHLMQFQHICVPRQSTHLSYNTKPFLIEYISVSLIRMWSTSFHIATQDKP